MKKYLPLIFLIALGIHACTPARVVTEPVIPEVEPPDVAVSRTITALRAGEASFDFFATRFSGTATIDNSNYSLSGNLRIRKDSAIFISVAPVLGIELLRVLITPREVRIINRLEGTYYEGGMELINNMLNTNLDYHMLEAILVGNDFGHYTTEHFRVTPATDRVLLQTENRYPLSPSLPGMNFEQNIWLDNNTYRIRENLIYEPEMRRSLRTLYSRFDLIGGQRLPLELSMVFIDPGTRAELTIRYSRTTINQPMDMTFVVPERYMPMNN